MASTERCSWERSTMPATRSRWRVIGWRWSRRCRRKRSSRAAPWALSRRAMGCRTGSRQRSKEGFGRHRCGGVFVVATVLRLLQNPAQHFDRASTDLLYCGLKLSALLALHRESVARGVDPAPLTVDAGEDGGSPLIGFAP